MRQNFDSYSYYFFGSRIIDRTIRYRVNLKCKVDPNKLKVAVNNYANRHPWIKCKTKRYFNRVDIIHNDLEIKVEPYSTKYFKFSRKETNYHYFYVQYINNSIYFLISHIIVGGVSFTKTIIEILKEYFSLIDNEFIFSTDQIDINKETIIPNKSTFNDVKPIIEPQPLPKCFSPFKELSKSMIGKNNLLVLKYSFDTDKVMKIVKSFDSSPSSFFAVLFYKALLQVYPKNTKPMCVQIMKNPLLSFPEYKNCHSFFGDKIYHSFPNNVRNYSIEKLCTFVRGRIFLENDISVNGYFINKYLNYCEDIDNKKTYLGKVIEYTLHSPTDGLKQDAFTFVVSYNGKTNEPKLEKYVDDLYIISGGTLILEITNLNNKMCLSLHLSKNYKKFQIPFEKVLKENHIPFTFKGIEKRYLPKNR